MSILLAWNFKVLGLHKSQKKLPWFVAYKVEHNQNGKKNPVSWIGLLNIEVMLSTFKSLLFHNSLSMSFRPVQRRECISSLFVQRLRVSLLNETIQHFTLIAPLKFSWFIWLRGIYVSRLSGIPSGPSD